MPPSPDNLPGRVFRRTLDPNPPVAVEAHGSTIIDSTGREYLDAAGGAVVVNVGHGRKSIADALADQAGRLSYAHGSAFTTEPLEAYAREIAVHLPVDGPAIYPVSGGSEAIETAVKLARAYHVARGETDRWIVVSRWGSYHGNTLGALDLSGRRPLRRPYEGWLGRFRHVSAAYPYRAGDPDSHALGDADELVAELERTFEAAEPRTIAAFVAEPIVGATLGAVVPPDGYWPRIAELCRRHGVLLIADEVMTGFGRTGRWFGLDHWGVRPDLLVAAKGATSGYWPFGFVAASDEIHATVTGGGGFIHGFTFSHAPAGAAVAREVLRILEAEDLVEASATKGVRLRELLEGQLGAHPNVGEIRGRGLLVGLELVADRATRQAFPRAARLTEAIVRGARSLGVLVYSGTGNADGVNGDTILLGPPFVVTDEELVGIVAGLGEAVEEAVAGLEPEAMAEGHPARDATAGTPATS
jgi:adenosylmethionine-8-amino-7-oxononanoate aminotransferase